VKFLGIQINNLKYFKTGYIDLTLHYTILSNFLGKCNGHKKRRLRPKGFQQMIQVLKKRDFL
jgi:hypothetical protein